jgi:endo-1,4-beta-xylanase
LGSKYSEAPTGLGTLDETAWRRFLGEVTGIGLDLLVTDLDVHDNPLPGAIGPRDREVAAHTRGYLDLMLYPQCRTVMCWGLGDKYSWLQPLRPRPDHLPKRPLPFDADLRPSRSGTPSQRHLPAPRQESQLSRTLCGVDQLTW